MKISISMAYERGFALRKVEELAKEVAEHLLKCYLMPESSYRKGWLKELAAWLDSSYVYGNIKSSRLKRKDYLHTLFAQCDEGALESRFLNSIKPEYPVDLEWDQSVVHKIEVFASKAAEQLSKKKAIVWREWLDKALL